VEFLANWLVQGSVIALVAAIVLRLLQRARAHARYWVCVGALSWVLVLPIVSLLTALLSQQPVETAAVPTSAPLVSIPHSPNVALLMIAVWAAWAGVHGVQFVRAALEIRKARRHSHAFPGTIEGRLRQWTRIRQHGRRARLVVSNQVRAAAVVGCGSPMIAVAPSLIRYLTAAELDRVVIHEWAHIQRRDDLANTALLGVRLLAGWHPAVWWLDRLLRLEREASCDEMAMLLTGSPKEYAACLIKLAELPLPGRQALSTVSILSSATVATRVRRIVSRQPQASQRWSTNAARVSVASLAAVACSLGSLHFVETVVVSSEPRSTRSAAPPVPIEAASAGPRTILATADSTATPAKASEHLRARAANARPGQKAAEVIRADTTVPEAVPDSGTSELPPGAPGPDVPLPARPVQIAGAQQSVPIAPVEQESPWAAAANAGKALGAQSKKGGLATGAFFTRFGKRIADSF
jgi:beta-lactamase regulating signal transducer with metallopeptidase domain